MCPRSRKTSPSFFLFMMPESAPQNEYERSSIAEVETFHGRLKENRIAKDGGRFRGGQHPLARHQFHQAQQRFAIGAVRQARILSVRTRILSDS